MIGHGLWVGELEAIFHGFD
jgi:hypothetical protein